MAPKTTAEKVKAALADAPKAPKPEPPSPEAERKGRPPIDIRMQLLESAVIELRGDLRRLGAVLIQQFGSGGPLQAKILEIVEKNQGQ